MKKVLLSITILCACTIAWASTDTSIKAEVDKTTLSTDQVLTYKLTVTSAEQKLPNPELPKFDGFAVVSQMQSSNFSFSKDQLKTEYILVCVLSPLTTGKLKIGPATLKINDQTYSSAEFQIEVTQGIAVPKSQAPQKEGIPSGSSSEQITL